MVTQQNPLSKEPGWPWAVATVTLSDRSAPCTGCRFSRGNLVVWLPQSP